MQTITNLATLSFAATAAVATAAPITGITTDPANPTTNGDGDITQNADLVTITAGGVTYDSLVAPEVDDYTNVTEFGAEPFVGNPTSVQVLDDLRVTNIAAGTGPFEGEFDFSSVDPLASDLAFFLFEVAGNDSFAITPVNENDTAIADTRILSDFGNSLLRIELPYENNSNDDRASSDFDIAGLSFTLDDFVFTGNRADFDGFSLTTTNGDLAAFVAGTVVPEPTSALAIAAGGLLLAARRRRA
jgi:hypothetical protein